VLTHPGTPRLQRLLNSNCNGIREHQNLPKCHNVHYELGPPGDECQTSHGDMWVFTRYKVVMHALNIIVKKGQSNLVIGDIAANWGSDPQIFPSRGRLGLLSNTLLLGTTRVSLPNGISFRPTALARCASVTDDMRTDGQTTLR